MKTVTRITSAMLAKSVDLSEGLIFAGVGRTTYFVENVPCVMHSA
jgi:hypothetical protein